MADASPLIVLVTKDADLHADHIVEELKRRSVPFARFHPKDFPARAGLTLSFSSKGWSGSLRTGKDVIDWAAVRSIWHRPTDGPKLHPALSPDEQKFADAEVREAVRGLWSLPACFWVNDPAKAQAASNKLLQLKVAAELGLRVPRTIITTDPAAVPKFYEECGGNIVYKTLAQTIWDGDAPVFRDGGPSSRREGVTLISRGVALLRPHRALFTGATLLLALDTAVGMAPALLTRTLFDDGLLKGDFGYAARVLAAQGGLFLLSLLLTHAWHGAYVRLGLKVTEELSARLYAHLQLQSLRFFIETSISEIAQRLQADVSSLETACSSLLGQTVVAVFKILTVGTVMLAWNLKLTLATVCTTPIIAVLSHLSSRLSRRLLQRQLDASVSLSDHLMHTLSADGYLLTVSTGSQGLQQERFKALNAELHERSRQRQLIPHRISLISSLSTYAGGLLVFLLGAFWISRGELSLGTLMTFVALGGYLRGPIAQLAQSSGYWSEAGLSLSRVFEYLDKAPDVADRPGARAVTAPGGNLAFRSVSFSYERGFPVLKQASFDIPAGKLTAIVGPTGAGKTTLAYLMMRLFDPDEGVITMDGTDLRDLTLESLRSQFGLVTQDCILFNQTIRENLLLGKRDADDGQLREACRDALILDRIEALPGGLDTALGEGGYHFSGGERQRLSLARALLQNPRILVLDEPTAFLDPVTEARFAETLSSCRGRGMTIIMIAHRMSVVAGADLIIAMEEGAVSEVGRHTDLLEKNGLYARLCGAAA